MAGRRSRWRRSRFDWAVRHGPERKSERRAWRTWYATAAMPQEGRVAVGVVDGGRARRELGELLDPLLDDGTPVVQAPGRQGAGTGSVGEDVDLEDGLEIAQAERVASPGPRGAGHPKASQGPCRGAGRARRRCQPRRRDASASEAVGVEEPADGDETAPVGDSRRAVADAQGPWRALHVRPASTMMMSHRLGALRSG